MALFGKGKNTDAPSEKPSTLDEVMEAYKRLSEEDQSKFKQSLQDRIDESVGEEEALHGEKDSQTAKDRIDEAIGTKLADDKKEEEKGESAPEEGEGEPEKENADVQNTSTWDVIMSKMKEVEERLARLEEGEKKERQMPKQVPDDKRQELDRLARIYNQVG